MIHLRHLPKVHRLCSQTAIDRLFGCAGAGETGGALAYPLRVVWAPRREVPADGAQAAPAVRFLISIPKKRLHHAVDRVLMRRRVREAYRLLRTELLPPDCVTPGPSGAPVCLDAAFIYVADAPVDYKRVYGAMKRLLRKMAAAAAPTESSGDEN